MAVDKASWSFRLLAAMLIFAPLFRGSVPALPLMFLQLMSIGLLLTLVLPPQPKIVLTRPQQVALAGLFLLPLLYLIPFPGFLAELYPGRDIYREAMLYANVPAAQGSWTLSIFPVDTELGWYVLLLPLAVFLAIRSMDTEDIRRLLIVLFSVVAFQSVLGLMQFGTGADGPFYFGMEQADKNSAVGTYVSRNNYVGLLEMVFPIALALFIATMGRGGAQKRGRRTLRDRLIFASTLQGHKAFIYAALAVLILLAIVFSRSRAGIGLTMLGLFIATLVFSNRLGGKNIYGLTGTVVAVFIGFAINIGLAPVLDRFSQDSVADARWTIFSRTLDGIGQFSPVGSGPSLFPEVFPAFQPVELGSHFINRAHNDYLEWMFEAGILAMMLIVLFLWLYARQWGRVWQKGHWQDFRFIQVGAGIGIFLMILHGLVDYNQHIPANIVFLAFLAGVFFHDYKDEVKVRTNRQAGVPADRTTPAMAPVSGLAPSRRPPENQVPNPFSD